MGGNHEIVPHLHSGHNRNKAIKERDGVGRWSRIITSSPNTAEMIKQELN